MGKSSKGSGKKSSSSSSSSSATAAAHKDNRNQATGSTNNPNNPKSSNVNDETAKALFERQLRLDRIAEYVEAEMSLPLGTFDLASLQSSLVLAATAAATNEDGSVIAAATAGGGILAACESSANDGTSGLEIPPRLAALQRQLELLDQQHQYQQQQLQMHHNHSHNHQHQHHPHHHPHSSSTKTPTSPPADALVASATATANQTEVSLRALRRRLAEVREQLYGQGATSFDLYHQHGHRRRHEGVGCCSGDENHGHEDDRDGEGGGRNEGDQSSEGDLDYDEMDEFEVSGNAFKPDHQQLIDPQALLNAAQLGLFQGIHTNDSIDGSSEDPLGLESVLELLASPTVPVEAKVEGIRTRFAAVLRQDLFWRSEAIKANRMVHDLRMDKELVEMELDKANVLKGKLESLCRDLQAENRRIIKEREAPIPPVKEPTSTAIAASKKNGKKNGGTLLTSSSSELPQPPPKLPPLRKEELAKDDKTGLIERIETLHKAYSAREELFETLQRTRDLELSGSQARLVQQQAIAAKAISRADSNERRIGQLVKSENELKSQVRQYVDKFRQVEETLGKSNELFGTFRAEMEQMSAKLGKLERENAQLHNKCATLSRNIIEMADERTKQVQAYETLKAQKAKLEQLCRTLQTERNAALKRSTPATTTTGDEKVAPQPQPQTSP